MMHDCAQQAAALLWPEVDSGERQAPSLSQVWLIVSRLSVNATGRVAPGKLCTAEVYRRLQDVVPRLEMEDADFLGRAWRQADTTVLRARVAVAVAELRLAAAKTELEKLEKTTSQTCGGR
jgi:hypothetical protein